MNLRPLLRNHKPPAYHITKHLLGKPATARNVAETRRMMRESAAIIGTLVLGCVGALLAYVLAALVFGL